MNERNEDKDIKNVAKILKMISMRKDLLEVVNMIIVRRRLRTRFKSHCLPFTTLKERILGCKVRNEDQV